MKKNTKGSAGARKTRHSKQTTKKPVTIDLTAEKVEQKASASKTASANKPTETKSTTSTPKVKSSTSGFGRDPGESKSNKTAEATKQTTTEKPKPKTVPKPPVKTSEPQSTTSAGLGGKLAAAIIGGVIALGGAGALQYMGYLSSPGAKQGDYASSTALIETRSDLLSKVEALQNRLKQAEAIPAFDPASINAAIDERIEKLQADNPATVPEVGKADIEGLDTKLTATGDSLNALQQQVEQMKQAISNGQAGEEAGLATLGSRLDTVDTRLSDIGTKLSAVEEKTSQPAKPDTATLTAIAALQTIVPKIQSTVDKKILGVSEQIEASKEETKTLVSPLRDQLEALTGKISDLTKTTETLSGSTKSANEKVSALQNTVDASIETERKAAKAIAAAAVKSAIDRGEPFGEALNTLKTVAGDSQELTALAAFSKSGVPTQTQLHARFEAFGEKIIAALTPKPEGNLSDRLLAGAKSLVKIKSIGAKTANTPRDKVSAIASQVSNGDLSAASKLWFELPEAGQSVSQEWHDHLQARISANQLVDQTVQTYLLSGSGQ